MTQLERWAARGLVKLPPAKKKAEKTHEQIAREERKKAQHREWLAKRRAEYKAAGLNWQGKPYKYNPPQHPPLSRKEYLARWKKQRLEAQQTNNNRKAENG